ncbi:MAG: DNA gyrase subunit B, partial [Planctomycetia bacterium]
LKAFVDADLNARRPTPTEVDGAEPPVEPSPNGAETNGTVKNGAAPDLTEVDMGPVILELHEVRRLNEMVPLLAAHGLGLDDLLPVVRKPGEEPPPRFVVRFGDAEEPMETVRDLAAVLRKNGEKGLDIKRFKGLGEMNADQLWNTTLDPAQRTMVRVTVDNGAAADEMFRTLMGEAVEPRREFIEKHALDVRNLDYHA